MGVSLFGDWDKAKKILDTIDKRFQAAAEKATMQEAHFLRGEIVKGIREGNFPPLAAATLAIRKFTGFGGTKPLVVSGDMRNSIVVKKDGPIVFVGILRTAKSKGGKSLANVAEMMEFGAGPFVVPITDKSRRFYHAAMRQAGLDPSSGGGHAGGGAAVAIVRIPARPFIRPVLEKYGKPEDVRDRFYKRIAELLGGDLGTPLLRAAPLALLAATERRSRARIGVVPLRDADHRAGSHASRDEARGAR